MAETGRTETERTGKDEFDELSAAALIDVNTLFCRLLELLAVFEYINCELTTTLPDVKLIIVMFDGTLPARAVFNLKLEKEHRPKNYVRNDIRKKRYSIYTLYHINMI